MRDDVDYERYPGETFGIPWPVLALLTGGVLLLHGLYVGIEAIRRACGGRGRRWP